MDLSKITIRTAKLQDAVSIAHLIDAYAQQGIMLAKPAETIIQDIRNFIVAELDGEVIGCGAVSFFTEELAEIRSVAVKKDLQNQGIGAMLVKKAEEILKEEGIKSVFALTMSEKFFKKLSYKTVEKTRFPQKIWRDCLGCSKIMQCDEVAMVKDKF
jgi:amino-acid N-acetyltransferase